MLILTWQAVVRQSEADIRELFVWAMKSKCLAGGPADSAHQAAHADPHVAGRRAPERGRHTRAVRVGHEEVSRVSLLASVLQVDRQTAHIKRRMLILTWQAVVRQSEADIRELFVWAMKSKCLAGGPADSAHQAAHADPHVAGRRAPERGRHTRAVRVGHEEVSRVSLLASVLQVDRQTAHIKRRMLILTWQAVVRQSEADIRELFVWAMKSKCLAGGPADSAHQAAHADPHVAGRRAPERGRHTRAVRVGHEEVSRVSLLASVLQVDRQTAHIKRRMLILTWQAVVRQSEADIRELFVWAMKSKCLAGGPADSAHQAAHADPHVAGRRAPERGRHTRAVRVGHEEVSRVSLLASVLQVDRQTAHIKRRMLILTWQAVVRQSEADIRELFVWAMKSKCLAGGPADSAHQAAHADPHVAGRRAPERGRHTRAVRVGHEEVSRVSLLASVLQVDRQTAHIKRRMLILTWQAVVRQSEADIRELFVWAMKSKCLAGGPADSAHQAAHADPHVAGRRAPERGRHTRAVRVGHEEVSRVSLLASVLQVDRQTAHIKRRMLILTWQAVVRQSEADIRELFVWAMKSKCLAGGPADSAHQAAHADPHVAGRRAPERGRHTRAVRVGHEEVSRVSLLASVLQVDRQTAHIKRRMLILTWQAVVRQSEADIRELFVWAMKSKCLAGGPADSAHQAAHADPHVAGRRAPERGRHTRAVRVGHEEVSRVSLLASVLQVDRQTAHIKRRMLILTWQAVVRQSEADIRELFVWAMKSKCLAGGPADSAHQAAHADPHVAGRRAPERGRHTRAVRVGHEEVSRVSLLASVLQVDRQTAHIKRRMLILTWQAVVRQSEADIRELFVWAMKSKCLAGGPADSAHQAAHADPHVAGRRAPERGRHTRAVRVGHEEVSRVSLLASVLQVDRQTAHIKRRMLILTWQAVVRQSEADIRELFVWAMKSKCLAGGPADSAHQAAHADPHVAGRRAPERGRHTRAVRVGHEEVSRVSLLASVLQVDRQTAHIKRRMLILTWQAVVRQSEADIRELFVWAMKSKCLAGGPADSAHQAAHADPHVAGRRAPERGRHTRAVRVGHEEVSRVSLLASVLQVDRQTAHIKRRMLILTWQAVVRQSEADIRELFVWAMKSKCLAGGPADSAHQAAHADPHVAGRRAPERGRHTRAVRVGHEEVSRVSLLASVLQVDRQTAHIKRRMLILTWQAVVRQSEADIRELFVWAMKSKCLAGGPADSAHQAAHADPHVAGRRAPERGRHTRAVRVGHEEVSRVSLLASVLQVDRQTAHIKRRMLILTWQAVVRQSEADIRELFVWAMKSKCLAGGPADSAHQAAHADPHVAGRRAPERGRHTRAVRVGHEEVSRVSLLASVLQVDRQTAHIKRRMLILTWQAVVRQSEADIRELFVWAMKSKCLAGGPADSAHQAAHADPHVAGRRAPERGRHTRAVRVGHEEVSRVSLLASVLQVDRQTAHIKRRMLILTWQAVVRQSEADIRELFVWAMKSKCLAGGPADSAHQAAHADPHVAGRRAPERGRHTRAVRVGHEEVSRVSLLASVLQVDRQTAHIKRRMLILTWQAVVRQSEADIRELFVWAMKSKCLAGGPADSAHQAAHADPHVAGRRAPERGRHTRAVRVGHEEVSRVSLLASVLQVDRQTAHIKRRMLILTWQAVVRQSEADIRELFVWAMKSKCLAGGPADSAHQAAHADPHVAGRRAPERGRHTRAVRVGHEEVSRVSLLASVLQVDRQTAHIKRRMLILTWQAVVRQSEADIRELFVWAMKSKCLAGGPADSAHQAAHADPHVAGRRAPERGRHTRAVRVGHEEVSRVSLLASVLQVDRQTAHIKRRMLILTWQAVVRQSEADIRELFVWAMKRCILMYILNDPAERTRLQIPFVPPLWPAHIVRAPVPWHTPFLKSKEALSFRYYLGNPVLVELRRMWHESVGAYVLEVPFVPPLWPAHIVRAPVPWHTPFLKSKEALSFRYYLGNPVLVELRRMWHERYQHIYIVDMEKMQEKVPFPQYTSEFMDNVTRLASETKKELEDNWLIDVADTMIKMRHHWSVYVAKKRSESTFKVESFFRCIRALMSNQVRDLVERSVVHFAERLNYYFEGNSYTGKYRDYMFIKRPILRVKVHGHPGSNKITFQPDLDQLKTLVLRCFQTIINVSRALPAIDKIMYPTADRPRPYLMPVNSDERYMVDALQTTLGHVSVNKPGPRAFLSSYEEFFYILNGQAHQELMGFMKQEPPPFLKAHQELMGFMKQEPPPFLKVTVLVAKQAVSVSLLSSYEEFFYILNGQAHQELMGFMKQEPPPFLKDFSERIYQYEALRDEIAFLRRDIPLNMIMLDCGPINDTLWDTVSGLRQHIVDHFILVNRKWNRNICNIYEEMAARASESPETTAQLVELINYIQDCRDAAMFDLREQSRTTADHVLFLMEHAHLHCEYCTTTTSRTAATPPCSTCASSRAPRPTTCCSSWSTHTCIDCRDADMFDLREQSRTTADHVLFLMQHAHLHCEYCTTTTSRTAATPPCSTCASSRAPRPTTCCSSWSTHTCIDCRDAAMFDLREQSRTTADHVLFLMEHAHLHFEDVNLNTRVFLWPLDMEETIDLTLKTLNTKKSMAEDKLRSRKTIFEDRLKKHEKDLELFRRFDPPLLNLDLLKDVKDRVDNIFRNLLDDKHEAEIIINEETMLDQEVSVYFSLQTMLTSIEPFHKLWHTSFDFYDGYEKWYHGPFLGLDAEQITEDVEAWWKLLYKLGKQLYEYPGAKRIADMVRNKLEKFKVLLPVLRAICNKQLYSYYKRIADMVRNKLEKFKVLLPVLRAICNKVSYIQLAAVLVLQAHRRHGAQQAGEVQSAAAGAARHLQQGNARPPLGEDQRPDRNGRGAYAGDDAGGHGGAGRARVRGAAGGDRAVRLQGVRARARAQQDEGGVGRRQVRDRALQVSDIRESSQVVHTPETTLADMVEQGVHVFAAQLEEIEQYASKEYALERALNKMKEEWVGVKFEIVPYSDIRESSQVVHTPETTLADMVEQGVHVFAAQLEEIEQYASKEYALERALNKMKEEWVGVKFEIVPYSDIRESSQVVHTPETTLADMVEQGVHVFAAQLEEIEQYASKEYALERALNKMKEEWVGVKFEIVPYSDIRESSQVVHTPETTLADMVEQGVHVFAAQLEEIEQYASKEYALERALNKMKEEWVGVKFEIVPYSDIRESSQVVHTPETTLADMVEQGVHVFAAQLEEIEQYASKEYALERALNKMKEEWVGVKFEIVPYSDIRESSQVVHTPETTLADMVEQGVHVFAAQLEEIEQYASKEYALERALNKMKEEWVGVKFEIVPYSDIRESSQVVHTPETTLADMVEQGVHVFAAQLEEIEQYASKEYALERALNKMKEEWVGVKFEIVPYSDIRESSQVVHTPETTLADMVEQGVHVFAAQLEEIEQYASKEYALERALNKMKEEWVGVKFEIVPYSDIRESSQVVHTPETTLADMVEQGVHVFAAQLEEIEQYASKEYALERALNKMKEEWVGVKFEIVPYSDIRESSQVVHTPETTLADMVEQGVHVFAAQLEEIEQYASKEYALERALNKMKEEWVGVKFEIVPYSDIRESSQVVHTPETTLADMVEQGVHVFAAQLEEIEQYASKEYALERALNKMKEEWVGVKFEIVPYRDTGVGILTGLDDVQQLLDDHILKSQTMRGSPYVKAFEADMVSWEEKLISMQDILDQWLACQATWMYLEPIFSSEDIMRQMPTEARNFRDVDKEWRAIMMATTKEPMVLEATNYPGLLKALKYNNALLEDIQRGLNDYLEKKRLFFPRFFFLSNDELLEILSETKDPMRVQPHLKKCFEGIYTLEFNFNKEIIGMASSEGEIVKLSSSIQPADAKGMVERWLQQLEGQMVMSLRDVANEAITSYPATRREQWVLIWPGQIVQSGSCVEYTIEIVQSGSCVEYTIEVCNMTSHHQLPRHQARAVGAHLARTDRAVRLLRRVYYRGIYPATRREQWVLIWPGQIVQSGSCVEYTIETIEAIETQTLPDQIARSTRQINGLVYLVQGDLKPGNRITVEALIVLDVHEQCNRVTVEALIVLDVHGNVAPVRAR
ncbi:hypothetical protein PYW07_017419 [Mythimna separata]|uniref:Dynein heavy chain linker domain-containing protein n=1 Tax=Mythimna separata TaxID=271217 RepID=A0AAD7YWD3_MYTSE|nr:hypothetical protein PYW07_017419 [Mythimna separata]